MANRLDKFEEVKNLYVSKFEDFEGKLNGHTATFLHDQRKAALDQLKELSFPTIKDEQWKYTNVTPILKENFKLPATVEETKVSNELIEKNLFTGYDYDLLVFTNGKFNEELSKVGELPKGTVIGSLAEMSKSNPELIKKYINEHFKIENAFNALNLAYAVDGAFIYVPEGKMLERPVQVVFASGHNNELVLSLPRNLIIAGKHSAVKISVHYIGYGDKPYFTNSSTEIIAEEKANLDYIKIQSENENSFHIDKTDVYQDEGSIFNHYSFAFGAALSRTDVNSLLDNQNIECHLYGLYLGTDKRHIDHHTFVDHAKPNCISNEVYKGILDDDSRGVFNGQIMVRQDAQKTNAYQSNKTVLLSESASIDTKPQLEIFADDVKCSHGATIGRLDDEAYFYIRSRGVEDKMAQSMLIHAFAADVIEAINIEPMREQLNHKLFEKLHRAEI